MSDTGISPIRIGISTCLLGERVRFDGGHKKNAFLTDTFGQYVQWVPVCPEVEIGLGTPREPIRLEHSNAGVRLVTVNSGIDHTQSMSKFARQRVRQLAKEQLCGYVFKKDSPSCGMVRVKVYSENGISAKTGRGLFADALIRRFPALPVEEEGRLCDPRLRENFVERVFAYHRLQQLFSVHWGVGALVQFHTAHKLQLMAHCPQTYQSLGRLVAVAKELPRSQLLSAF